MRVCNLQDGLGQLSHAAVDLNQCWTQVKEHWKDDNGRQFEESHLAPISPQMQQLIAAVQNLAQSVAKAVSELEDRGGDT